MVSGPSDKLVCTSCAINRSDFKTLLRWGRMRSGPWVVALLVPAVAACGRLHFDDLESPADAVIEDAAIDAAIDATAYRASAVSFVRGEGDYLWTGFLANTVNSNKGTYSIWLRFRGGDGQTQLLSVAQVVAIGGVLRESSNRFRFLMQNCAGIPLLDMQSTNAYTAASGWVHVLASWDLANDKADLYVDDVEDRAASPGILDGNICYASVKWGIGGLVNGQLEADVAELYAALGTYIDLSQTANRRKFITEQKRPADLGPGCTTPTGAAPTGCFVGDTAAWFTNKGDAGGMNVEGNGLLAAPTSPSD